MTTIDERARLVHTKVVDRGRKKAGQHLVQRLTETAARADRASVRLQGAMHLERELTADDVAVSPLDKRIADLAKKARSQLRSTATKLESRDLDDAESVRILDGRAFQDALRIGDDLVDRLAAVLTKALEAERIARLPAGIEESIPDVPGEGLAAIRLERLQLTLTTEVNLNALSFSPVNVDDLLDARRKRTEAAREWTQQYARLLEQLADQHPEMQAFLRAAASSDGASLSLLTAEVRSRLETENALDHYRVHQQR